ncbi:MAG: glucose-6-phosphate dehydrogenase assembly protein OpcA [Vulcanimicrobiaceae bacterium]
MIDALAIRSELNRARTAATSGDIGAATRVATMNFVVFVDDQRYRPWVFERAAAVAEKHPSRLIVLDSSGLAHGVDVSSHALQCAGATIVSERVDVAVDALDHATIASLVQELAVPELPLVLWWTGARLLQSRTFSLLAQGARTVVVDSSGSARGEETVRELGEFLSRFPNPALHDLAFMRLLPWQDMIAQFFDDPALREDLFSLRSLEIQSGSEAEALYLGGWLGSRLSWEPTGRDAFRDRRGGVVTFSRSSKGDQRRVRCVTLRSDDSTYCACLADGDENVVRLQVEGARAKPRWFVPLQNIANTALIERAILESERDQIFETSLVTVHALLA